jgi:hypothetical protein
MSFEKKRYPNFYGFFNTICNPHLTKMVFFDRFVFQKRCFLQVCYRSSCLSFGDHSRKPRRDDLKRFVARLVHLSCIVRSVGVIMKVISVVGLVVCALVASIPKAVANSVGLCYANEFIINGKLIKRPEHFKSKGHKAAFEIIGKYITNALTRDAMEVFRLSSILENNFYSYHRFAPAEVWEEVLAFFEAEGAITCYWVMLLPSKAGYNITPEWGPDGEDIAQPKVGLFSGAVADSVVFCPGLLTDSQKQELIAVGRYAEHRVDYIGPGSWQQPEQTYAVITAANFERLYHRNRKVLSEDDLKRGAEDFVAIVTASQS